MLECGAMARRATMSMGLAAIGAAFWLAGCGRHALPGMDVDSGSDAAATGTRSGSRSRSDTLSAYFNGTLVANASDPGAPIPAGGVALGTIYSGAEFDDVRVTLP